MAKRGAGSELNHDNWDKEEESEEAGEFRRATADQMKGRVIKKAKRRNLDENQKKNIFSGFGGFVSQNNVDAKDAFSFLSKSEVKSDKEQDSSPKETEKEENLEGEKVETVVQDDIFAKFKKKSGTWTCDVCMISNEDSTMKCIACESCKPGSNTNKNVPLAPEKTSDNPPVQDSLFAKFTSKSDKWSCDICMISNDASKIICAACESPKPGEKKPEPESSKQPASTFTISEGGGFKFAADTSSSVNNSPFQFGNSVSSNETSMGGFKFGSTDTKEENKSNGFKFGSLDASESKSTGFNFGTTVDSNTTNGISTEGFKFGVTNSDGFKFGTSVGSKANESNPVGFDLTETNEENKSNGFKFGTLDASESKSTGFTFGTTVDSNTTKGISTEGFKFGVTKSEEKKSDGFTFGTSVSSKANESNPVGFNFGSAQGTSEQTKALGSFKFGSTEAKTDKQETAVMNSISPKANRNEYLSGLKSLNIQVTDWIKTHVDTNPLVDLTPVFKDYEQHLNKLRTKSNWNTSTKSSNEESKGACETEEKDKIQTFKPFTFNATTSPSAAESGYQFGDQMKKVDDENIMETVLEKPPERVVETDALYSKKCKLFYKKGGAYEERGLGHVHLKKTEDDKLQLVIRADTSLGNILLNIIMNEEIPVERVGKNNVMIICIPNPLINPKDDPEPVTFLIRVKTSEDADELKSQINNLSKS